MENIKHYYTAMGSSIYQTRKTKQQILRFKFAEVKSYLRLRKYKKLPQTYCKLVDLRLRTTYCYFAEFAVAE